MLFERGRPEHVDWRGLGPILVAAVPGLAVGVVALTQLSKAALQVGVGLAVIAAVAWQLRRRRRTDLPAWGAWAVGFASGALTTSISVSGPPIVLWLEARGVRPEEFRASLAASFLALNLAGGVLLVALEGVAAIDAGALLGLLGLVLAGHVLGALAFRRADHERFFTAVLVLVARHRSGEHRRRLRRLMLMGSEGSRPRAPADVWPAAWVRLAPPLRRFARRAGRRHRRHWVLACMPPSRMRTCVRSWSSASSTPASSCSPLSGTGARCSPSRSLWPRRPGASSWWGRCRRRPRPSAWCAGCGWARR